jgi:hypothetical protein
MKCPAEKLEKAYSMINGKLLMVNETAAKCINNLTIHN